MTDRPGIELGTFGGLAVFFFFSQGLLISLSRVVMFLSVCLQFNIFLFKKFSKEV